MNTCIWTFSILFAYIFGLVSILDVAQYICLIKMQQLLAFLYTWPSKKQAKAFMVYILVFNSFRKRF